MSGRYAQLDIWKADLEDSIRNIRAYEEAISELLIKQGLVKSAADVAILNGLELEITRIYGKASANKRTKLISQTGIHVNDKSEKHVPKQQRVKHLYRNAKKTQTWQPFTNTHNSSLHALRNSSLDEEPLYGTGIGTDKFIYSDENHGEITESSLIAFSPIEVVSGILRPLGAAAWLKNLPPFMLKEAEKYKQQGLKRLDFQAVPHPEASVCSIHHHIGLVIKNGDKTINLMARDSFKKEVDELGKNPQKASKLAIAIAHAIDSFAKEAFAIYAPTENCIKRLRNTEPSGPAYIGFGKRKSRLGQPGCMFRGAGRESFRENAPGGKPDKGDLRIEVRYASPLALGHPNRSAYPELINMSYELIEAHMFCLLEGIKIALGRENYGGYDQTSTPVIFDEDALYERKSKIPTNRSETINTFRNSNLVRDCFGGRVDRILARHMMLEALIERDNSAYTRVKGPHVTRAPYSHLERAVIGAARRVEFTR